MEDNYVTIEKEKYQNLQMQLMELEIATINSLDNKVEKVLEWARQRNIHKGSTPLAQYAKCVSEIGELGDALLKNNKDDVVDAIGDALVVLINLAEMCQTNLDTCLFNAYEEIKNRQGVMWNGVFIKETDANYERIIKHVKAEQVQTDIFSKD